MIKRHSRLGKMTGSWGVAAALAAFACSLSVAAWSAGSYQGRGSGQWMEKLGLSPAQIPSLLKALGTRRETMSPLFAHRKELLAQLSSELKSKAPESRVEETLTAFDEVKSKMREANKKFLDDENQILTPLQRAKLIVDRSEKFQKIRAQKGQSKAHSAY